MIVDDDCQLENVQGLLRQTLCPSAEIQDVYRHTVSKKLVYVPDVIMLFMRRCLQVYPRMCVRAPLMRKQGSVEQLWEEFLIVF